MTIKELKELIHDIPDEAEVYIADEDMGEEAKATDIYYAVKNTSFQKIKARNPIPFRGWEELR